jgi:hypothetical protein
VGVEIAKNIFCINALLPVVRSEDVRKLQCVNGLGTGAGFLRILKRNGYFEQRPHPRAVAMHHPSDACLAAPWPEQNRI